MSSRYAKALLPLIAVGALSVPAVAQARHGEQPREVRILDLPSAREPAGRPASETERMRRCDRHG
jgi:hypothetical protein